MRNFMQNLLVALGFRAPGEPTRKELRSQIREACDKAVRHSRIIEEKCDARDRERTGEIRAAH